MPHTLSLIPGTKKTIGSLIDITFRKLAGEETKAGEHRFRGLFNNISSCVAVYKAKDDGNDFIFKDINRAAERIENVKKEDLIGKGVLEVFPGVKEFGLFDGFKRVWERGKPENHPIYLYKGERIMGCKENYVYKLPSGEIVAIYDDVTERKQAEQKIKHIDFVLRAIRNINQIIVTKKDRGKLLKAACESLVETCGYYNAWIAMFDESGKLIKTFEAGLGDDFLPMIKFLERGDITHCGRTALSQSDVVVIEDPSSTCADCPLSEEYSGMGAMTIRLVCDGRVYGLLSVSTSRDFIVHKEEQDLFKEVAGDIGYALRNIEQEKKRIRMEEVLRQSEEKYRTLVQTLSDVVFIINPDGNFTYLNPEFERLTGYPFQDFIGRPFTEMLAPEYIESTVDRFKRGLSGAEIPIYEVEFLHKDGKNVPVELKVTSLLDDEGRAIDRIGLARDISECKQAEDVLKGERSGTNVPWILPT